MRRVVLRGIADVTQIMLLSLCLDEVSRDSSGGFGRGSWEMVEVGRDLPASASMYRHSTPRSRGW
jgi:hypothetical protein